MDRLEKSTGLNEDGFIKEVFPFDEDQKGLLLNIIQYSVLAIIPVVVLLKLIKNYIPEADDDKGSLVILVEVVGQIVAMFTALYFIHKIIAYVPTYSGFKYGDVNVFNMIPAILFISVTMQTKLGEKIQMLVDRLWDLYEGQTSSGGQAPQRHGGQQGGQVRVTQPLTQSQQMSPQYSTTPSMAPGNMPSVNNPPPQLQSQMTNMKSQSNEYSIPQSPDFNSMYGGPETPMVGASTPGMMEAMEPMAANDSFGGAFGSAF
jgi:hypothetical protein